MDKEQEEMRKTIDADEDEDEDEDEAKEHVIG